MRSNLVLSIRAEYGRVTCPCGGAPHNKDYTTLLPNIGFYDINTSTNKCTSGAKGRPKTTYYVVYTLHFSRQKKGEKTEKCQRGLKTASKTSCLDSGFFIILGRNVVNGSNPIILVKKLAKRGLTNNTGRK